MTLTESLKNTEMAWGSDAVAALLRALDLKYAALVPGASYRGLHDSIVNYLGNENPEMLLCLHEEHAVAIAHGLREGHRQADAGDRAQQRRPDARDRWRSSTPGATARPVLILGANGPVDAMKRRPWIDWIHTVARHGRARAPVHEVGRSARLARRRDRVDPARLSNRRDAAQRRRRSSCSTPQLQEQRLDAAARASAAREVRRAARRRCRRTADVERILAALARREASGHPRRPLRAHDRSVERTRRARRSAATRASSRETKSARCSRPTIRCTPASTGQRRPRRRRCARADVILDLDILDLAGVLKSAKVDGHARR